MNILNVMWSGGAPFSSIHSVHRQVLAHAGVDARVNNWLLLGDGLCSGVGQVRNWHLPARVLKGRLPHRLTLAWVRWRLRRALRDVAPDVLLVDGLGVARLLLPLMQHFPEVRISVLFHGATRLTGSDIALFRRFPIERLSVAAVSATLAGALERDLRRQVRTLRVALDPEAFGSQLPSRAEARRRLGLASQASAPVLGAVGRLVESKGFELLIEAFAKANAAQPGMQLVILGDGPLRGKLEARVRSLGVGDSVRLYGHREDSTRLYPAFDWLFVPSHAEGLGLVVQEAVLSRVPVVCSDLPVFREQLGESGCYLPVGDESAWAAVMSACRQWSTEAKASEQWKVLAPDKGWQAFKAGSAGLLER